MTNAHPNRYITTIDIRTILELLSMQLDYVAGAMMIIAEMRLERIILYIALSSATIVFKLLILLVNSYILMQYVFHVIIYLTAKIADLRNLHFFCHMKTYFYY